MHTPLVQVAPGPQTVEQLPQWLLLAVTSVQAPPHTSCPDGQFWHCPETQFWPVAQTLVHEPQWLGSVAVLVQVAAAPVPQMTSLFGQG